MPSASYLGQNLGQRSDRRWSDPGPCLFHSASSRTITLMVMAIPRRHAVFTHIRLATDVRST
jgi:hypothetical protein